MKRPSQIIQEIEYQLRKDGAEDILDQKEIHAVLVSLVGLNSQLYNEASMRHEQVQKQLKFIKWSLILSIGAIGLYTYATIMSNSQFRDIIVEYRQTEQAQNFQNNLIELNTQ